MALYEVVADEKVIICDADQAIELLGLKRRTFFQHLKRSEGQLQMKFKNAYVRQIDVLDLTAYVDKIARSYVELTRRKNQLNSAKAKERHAKNEIFGFYQIVEKK